MRSVAVLVQRRVVVGEENIDASCAAAKGMLSLPVADAFCKVRHRGTSRPSRLVVILVFATVVTACSATTAAATAAAAAAAAVPIVKPPHGLCRTLNKGAVRTSYVDSCQLSIRLCLHIVFHRLSIFEGTKALGMDLRLVNKDFS